ncbi:hypothetical protein P691DRAFT_766625 [Macrolepiota fuliginosa MF-IS2]|uniref:Uncharacterized protein n=1 Tax=Macrolepiota fuliginosa MF-IS2 TaxID=1400762 RepID=A0A9P5X0F5_9AGAR|nr:hypothetical protein P691DRAFT_766625 [Macrolepiota fuliginosa MF-IS2]
MSAAYPTGHSPQYGSTIFAKASKELPAIECTSTLILTYRDQINEPRGINAGLVDWAKICIVEEVASVPLFASGNIIH